MSFSIQTNVNALIAQENLRVNSNFQSQTIQRLTSGYRINQSGDDAAGLAVANKFRSDISELTQGVRNANDGVSQLQIMDGGISNISKMLDRLKTLATQSASDTFTGDRSVLNSEYQTLVGEIDRQAQTIGLGTNGHFATKMTVYIGGGVTSAGTQDTANGSVGLDLSNSAVDTKALGLSGQSFQATGAAGTDIGAASQTSVTNIVANTNNSTTATFTFSGAGYSGVQVSADLTGVSGTADLVNRLNAAITAASNGSSAFKGDAVTASVVTGAGGGLNLQFSSANGAFQVAAGNKTANALMGHYKTGAEGADVTETYTAGTAIIANGSTDTAAKVKFIVDGVASAWSGAIDLTATTTIANRDTAVQTALSTALTALGKSGEVTEARNAAGDLSFTGLAGHSFEVQVQGDSKNVLGLGSWSAEVAGNTGLTGAAPTVGGGAESETYAISIGGGQKVTFNVAGGAADVTALTAEFTAQFNANTTLTAAGFTAAVNGGTAVKITANAGINFRINLESRQGGATMDAGFGVPASAVASTGSLMSLGNPVRTDAAGTAETSLGSKNDVYSFAGLRNLNDAQTLSFSATDANGVAQSVNVNLTGVNANALDTAVATINAGLQGASSSVLNEIVAVKENNVAGTAEGIRFISKDGNFSVTIGTAANETNANPVGLYDATSGVPVQGKTYESTDAVSTSAGDISTSAGAKAAVVALGNAVTALGSAQAAVGKSQNQLGYAVGLANSQIDNFSAAESQIRDADVAAEAANLTKASVLQQATMAAMAQANTAPQAVLALLRG